MKKKNGGYLHAHFAYCSKRALHIAHVIHLCLAPIMGKYMLTHLYTFLITNYYMNGNSSSMLKISANSNCTMRLP